MKLKYFISFFALIALLASCSDDEAMTLLDEIQVSSSYVSINVDGGSNTITLSAKEAWSFDAEEFPEWLTVSPMAGGAGETNVTLHSPASPVMGLTVSHSGISSASNAQEETALRVMALEPPSTSTAT